ncbi:MAG: hypothetical protein MK077_07690 [Phycisphaerales bacterium]|nr:hypothetical protein [Phycisphaerales bacterium]
MNDDLEQNPPPSRRVISRMPTARDRDADAKLWHDASVLRKLYEQDGRTQAQIAKQLGCSTLTINKAFKKFGIHATRGRRPGQNHKQAKAVPPGARVVARTSRHALENPTVKRFAALVEMMEELGPHAREGVKRDLHELIDRL